MSLQPYSDCSQLAEARSSADRFVISGGDALYGFAANSLFTFGHRKLAFFSDCDADGCSCRIGAPGRPGQGELQPYRFEIHCLFMKKLHAPRRSSGPENVEEC
jgi:hypothetical protein